MKKCSLFTSVAALIHEKISRQEEIEFHLIQDTCKKKEKKITP